MTANEHAAVLMRKESDEVRVRPIAHRYDVEGEGLRIGFGGSISLTFHCGQEWPSESYLPEALYARLEDIEFELMYEAFQMAREAFETIKTEYDKHMEIKAMIAESDEKSDQLQQK